MNNNYMLFPMKYMRITCSYDEGAHKKQNSNVTDGNIAYPIDNGGYDYGKDPVYCPCDEMKITAIRGVGDSLTTNTIWLVSTSKVITPTFVDQVFMTLTHSNDDDIKNLKVGDTFKRGDIICHEGKDGNATGNHIHMTVGRGYSNTWVVNSNGALVIKGNCQKPEDVFFVDKNFTTILDSGNLNWIFLKEDKVPIIGTPQERNPKVDQVEVLVDNLNLRESYSTESKRIGYIRRGIYNVLDKKENEGYLWMMVENYWIATNTNWTIYYPKEENNNDNDCSQYKLIFECNETGKYIIYLNKGDKLYLKK